MNITRRQTTDQIILKAMIKGAGGDNKFDLVRELVKTYPKFAEELGRMTYTLVREMEDQAITEDEKFELEMNEIAQARGYPSHNNQKGILVTLE